MVRYALRSLNLLGGHHRTSLSASNAHAIRRHFAICTEGGRGHRNQRLTPASAVYGMSRTAHIVGDAGLLRNSHVLGLTSFHSVAHKSTYGLEEFDLINLGVDGSIRESAPLALTQIVYGKFRNLMSRETWCVDLAARYLENIHHYTGMPWWATIMVTTVATHTMVQLPLRVTALRAAGRRHAHEHELVDQARRLELQCKDAMMRRRFKNQREANTYFATEYNDISRKFEEKYNCSPVKMISPALMNFFMIYSFSFGLRELLGFHAGEKMLGMYKFFKASDASFGGEGALWFPDLRTPDSSRALGTIAASGILVSGEIANTLTGSVKENHEKQMKKKGIKNAPSPPFLAYAARGFVRVMAVWVFYISGHVPAGLALYWATSNCLSLSLTVFTETPTFRRLFNVPMLPRNSDTPFRQLMNKAQLRFQNRFSMKK